MQNLKFFPTLDNLWNRPTVIINFDVQIFTYWETKIASYDIYKYNFRMLSRLN